MADRLHTPLSLPHWMAALREVAFACTGAAAQEESECLRAMAALIEIAPHGTLPDGMERFDPVSFEQKLTSGCFESAALALLCKGASYMVSGGGGGQFLATAVRPGQRGDCMAPGETMALALTSALASALIEMQQAAVVVATDPLRYGAVAGAC
jgi:hypothetical protein